MSPVRSILAQPIVVWLGLALYLVLFYGSSLRNLPAGPGQVLRGRLWASLLLPDEVVRHWVEGCTRSALVDRAMILATAGAILAMASVAGWACLAASDIVRRLTRLECFVFSTAVGLNLTSLLTLALGLCGMLHIDVFAAVALGVLAAAGLVAWWRHRAIPPPSVTNEVAEFQSKAGGPLQLNSRWLWVCVPFALAILGSALLPPADFDVREYHLQAPKEYYLTGRITFLPHNVYANMPLGTEMLSLLGMIGVGDWWIGALVGKTLIACFALLTAFALVAAGRRFASPAAGVIAALVYLSIPWVALVSTQGLVEGGFAFYWLMAVYGVLLWREWLAERERDNRPLALAGFLAGAAAACKYPAVLYCIVPLGVWIAVRGIFSPGKRAERARDIRGFVRPLAVFLMAITVGCGPWFVKNAVLTGNPTYPLLYGVFDGRTRTAQKEEQWSRAHRPPDYTLSDLVGRAADVTWRSDWLSPVIVPLAVLAFVTARRQRLAIVLAGYLAYVFCAWWLLTHRIDRFWVPALPLAALLAGIGATWTDARWWRGTLAVFLAAGLLFDFVVITSGQLIDNRYLADLNVLRDDPQRVEPWHRYLNAHRAEVTRVLLVGDAQPFDLEVPALYNTVFDDCIFEQLARDRTPEQVHAALAAREISHIYVSWREVDRYRSPGNYGITEFLTPAVFERLVASGVLARLPMIPDDRGELFRVAPLP